MIRRLLFLLLLIGCATPKKQTGVLAPQCEKTAVQLTDLTQLGFHPVAGKIGVMRIFASWCPFCKEDLTEIGQRFKQGEFKPDDVQVYLLAYKNSKESRATYDEFVKKVFPAFSIPKNRVELVYLDKSFEELSRTRSSSGERLFTGWQGMPFGLIFGKDSRLVFRGHFTTSPQFQDNHYLFIRDLTKESCS